MGITDLNILVVFSAGFLSFISPCCLPLYPSYLSYVTGVSVNDLKTGKGLFQKQALLHTVFFILGFSIIFFALGLSASLVGNLFSEYQNLIRQLGGIMVALFGLVMLGIFTPKILLKSVQFKWEKRPMGYLGSVLVGITYAAGWTPCVGPILAAVLALGVSNPGQAMIYTVAYTIGFSIPFFVMAFFIGKIRWLLKYSNMFMKVGGVLMFITGVLLYTDKMTEITIFFIKIYGGFTGF